MKGLERGCLPSISIPTIGRPWWTSSRLPASGNSICGANWKSPKSCGKIRARHPVRRRAFPRHLELRSRAQPLDRLQPLGAPEAVNPSASASRTLRTADSGWEAATDTPPPEKPEKGQTLWHWRRDAPIRPDVFRDPEEVTNEVVQFHLEHRVIQWLLQRFLSQGFVHDDLLAQVDVSITSYASLLEPVSAQAATLEAPSTSARILSPMPLATLPLRCCGIPVSASLLPRK